MTKKNVRAKLEEIADSPEMEHLWAGKDPTTEAIIAQYASALNMIQEGGEDAEKLREWVGIIGL